MCRHAIVPAALLSLMASMSTAGAQPVVTSPSPLIIDRDRVDRRPPESSPAAPPTREAIATVEGGTDASGVVIRGIRFEGTRVPAPVARSAEAFVGRSASIATLQALATAMSNAYARSAVALYTVSVPAQDFADGVVRVRVAEGFIEGVTITGDVQEGSVDLVRRYAGRLTRERPLTRVTLERYLSLIRDIPDQKVDAQLLRGATAGGVRLVLKLDRKPVDVSLSFDNRTSTQIDDGQFQATGKLFGLLREGDETDVVLAASANLRNYRYAALSHATPIGTEGTRLTGSIGYLDTRLWDGAIDGEATVASLIISHPVIRGYRRNLTVSASLDGVDSDNALLGSLLSREHIRAARAAAAFSDGSARRNLSTSLTFSKGLDILSARVIEPLAEADFTKVSGRAGIDQAIGKRIVLRVSGSGQWTGDRLPAVERFIVGGREFGRAFPVALLAGDRGVAGLAELAWRPRLSAALAASEVYVFGDAADVDYLPRGAAAGGSFDLASAGAGIRLAWRDKAVLELEAARPVDRPYPGFPRRWQFNVGWRLSLGR